MGGAIHYSQIDIIARIKRMQGYKVHFPMGLDRNGLPIELATEKRFKIRMEEMERSQFLEKCKELLDEYGGQILNLCHGLGMSCNSFDWEKIYLTDGEKYRKLTQQTFLKLWEEGLIYEDDRPNNWDPILKTTIADAEIEYETGTHTLYHIQFRVEGQSYAFATTRPELIPAIRVIIYNPNDQRYQHLKDKTAEIPIWNLKVKLQPHSAADPDFGSGLVQICSYGDLTDIQILRELQITPRYAIDLAGRLTEATGDYQGLTIIEGRKTIVNDLHNSGMILKEETIPYRYPISERSGAKIEFIGMKEYYLKQEEFLPELREYAEQLDFYPEGNRQILLDWLDRVNIDWPISRRRYYGTEIPLWNCVQCHTKISSDGKYYVQPWKDPAPVDSCPKCGSQTITGESRIFDTWMDSSISALYISRFPNNELDQNLAQALENREYLCDLRPQGKEIVRTWLNYTILRIHHQLQKPAFKEAWISGHVVTESGEKMSKSKGNAVSPEPILDKYGADALRLFACSEASLGSDIRFSEERLRGTSKYLNKLYNIARFIARFDLAENGIKQVHATDKWFRYELNQLIKRVNQAYQEYDFLTVCQTIRSFTTELFASHYLELCKNRAYNRDQEFEIWEETSARKTLYQALEVILLLLAPITPFITDYIYRELWGQSIHLKTFPKFQSHRYEFSDDTTQSLTEFNRKVWKQKQDRGISLRDPILIEIEPELEAFAADLTLMHNISNK